jgi:hypothetical protein
VRIVGIVALVLVGCTVNSASVPVYIPTNAWPHASYVKQPEDVAIFMTGRPSRPFVEVGMIEVQQKELPPEKPPALFARMRAFAGTLGCDALAIFASNDGIVDPGGKYGASTLKGYRGACIVYVDAPPPTASAPSVASVPSEPLRCLPNSTQLCYGPGGCRGAQSCTPSGNAYTRCDCSDATAHVQATSKR